MAIAQWLQQQFTRGSGRKRAARRDFQKRFAAQLSVKPLESRLVLSAGGGGILATTLLELTAGNLTITDVAIGGKNDNLTLTADVANDRLTIHDPTAILSITGFTTFTLSGDCHTAEVALSEITGGNALVNTLDGSDLLHLNYALGGNPLAVQFNGGNSLLPFGDQLQLSGGSFATADYLLTNLNAGAIELTGSGAISYQAVERVTDSLLIGERQFEFAAGSETITASEFAGMNQLQYHLGGPLSERLDFTNPTNSLSLLTDAGDDVVDLVAMAPGFTAAFTVNGEGGNDTINVSPALSVPLIMFDSDVTLAAEGVTIDKPLVAKSIDITTDVIQINAPLAGFQGITLRPANDAAAIGLDGSGSFNLTASELAWLFSSTTVTIGHPTGTGAIDIGTVDFSSKNFNLMLLGGDTTFNGGVTLSANKSFTLSVGTITSPNSGTDITLPNGTLIVTATGPNGTTTDPLTLDIRNLETNSAAGNGDQFLQNVTPGPIFLTSNGLNAGIGTIHLLGSVFVLGGSERIADASALVFDGTFLGVGNETESVRQFTLVNGNVAGGGSGKIISLETIPPKNGVVQVKLEGSDGLTKATAGTVEVFQPMTYPGDTLIDAGTLRLGTAELIPHGAGNGDVTINTNGTLDLNGFAETINGLSGDGQVTNAGGIVQFTVGADDDTSSFTGNIQGNLILFKVGAGTLTLAGTNTYLPATVVVNGAVHITGSTTANTFVQNGATFGGTGTTTGTVNVNPGGKLAPGVTIGSLTAGDVTLNSGSIFEATIDGNVPGVSYDQLVVNGTVTLNNAILSLNGTIQNVGANEIVLIANDSNDSINGIFQGLPEGAIVPVNGHNYRLSYIGGDGNDVALSADTLVSLVSGNLTITDIFTTTNDNLTIFSDVANSRYIITDPGRIIGTTVPGAVGDGTSTIFVPFASVSGSEIQVNTLDGSDRLTIDYSKGLFTKSVVLDGGNYSGAPDDQLLLTGGGLLNTVAHTFTTETDGSIASTGNSLVSYQNLEGLNDNLLATNRSFTFNGGDETITLTDDPAVGFNQIDSTVGIGVVFANPLNSLSVNAGSGNDSVITSPLDPALSAAIDFQINGGSGTNEWTINTPLTADVDEVQITGTTVQLQTNAVAKPTMAYSSFDTLNVNTYGGSDQIVVQLGGSLPTTINLDGGTIETPDIVTVRGDQALSDQLRLENSHIVDQVTGKVIQLTDIEQLVVNLAGDSRNDQVTMERTFALSGGTPSVTVQGDGSPLDRLLVNTEPTLASVTADVVAIDADSVDLVGWLPILYSDLEQVTLNTGAGDDLIAVTPSSNTRLVIDGGPAALPTFPGDRVEFNLTGVVTPTLAIPDPGAGLLASANRREVQLTNIETFAATGTGTFVVTLDANSRATNDAADGNADTFNLVRQGTTTEIAVNGQTIFRGERADIAEIQITGSADNDATTVDFAAGNTLSPGGLQFIGNGGTNSLQMIQGSVEKIVHDVAGPQAGLITIEETVGLGTVTSTISYTQINSPLLDDLLTNTRELHLTSAADNVLLRENTAANRSEIINAGAATFVDLIQRNPTNNLLITGNAGNDTFTIDSNGSDPGGTIAFVTFAVEIVGGSGELDRLVVNDTSNAADATLAMTETTLDFGGGVIRDRVIRYRGMEDLDLTLGSGNDEVTVTDDPLINADPLGNADPEANAAATFTLRTGVGNDVVNIASIDAGYRAATTIVGDAGNDRITQLVDLTLGSAISTGNLTYAAERIELAADLATTGGFAKYAGNVTLLTDVRIDTDASLAGGTIEFTQTVESSLAGAKNLTLDAGIADIVFSAGVGVTQPLRNLTIDEAHNLSFLGQLQTLGNVTQTTGTGQTLFNGSAAGIGGQLLVQTNVIELATGDIVTTGNINLHAANQITFGTNAGINATTTTATIRIAANQDNVGNENFTQDETALIQTTSNAANAVTILVDSNGSALISDIRTGSTGGITINVGGEIVDNSVAETPNLTSGQATLTAGTGIGVGGDAAGFDTQIAVLTAPANGGDIVILDVDSLTLQGITTSGGRVQITAGGLLTIQDTTAVTNATGQVSNIPPLLRIAEDDPNDVILPGDPTQEIRGTIGGDQLLGDNKELARNLTFTVVWADGVVSEVSGLNAGDTLTWFIGPQGEGTPVITPGLVAEGPLTVFVQRHYSLAFLQTVTAPEVISVFTLRNDANIVLNDQRPLNLNATLPLPIATTISETDFRPPPFQLLPPPPIVVEVRRPSLIGEVTTSASSRTITYEEIETVVEEADAEEAQLYLVQVGIDGTEGPRIKLPLAELRNLAGLLDRLKQAPIPSGLYRIYHQEPGLTSRQLIEFRKAGKNIGDPVREPGRGSNPLEAKEKKPADELPRNNQNSQHVPAPADEHPAQAYSRIARWRRQREA